MKDDVIVERSKGRGQNGKAYMFVRPAKKCMNRSRRVTPDKVQLTTDVYFTPMNYYLVNGWIIGSNTERNALKEYWRVCANEDIGKEFTVEYYSHPDR
jgi:hypothetical protein